MSTSPHPLRHGAHADLRADDAVQLRTPRSLLALAVSIAAVALVGWAGSQAGTSDSAWYRALDKPPWNPPGWVFGVVWSILYLLMAVAAWLAIRPRAGRRTGPLLALYSLQLAVNLAWSWLFFGAHSAGWALADITLVVLLVAATTVAFARVSRLAGLLFIPYLAWVAFASSINLWIVVRS